MHIRLSARSAFSSAGVPPVRHSFILNRGNNRREPEYELHKSTSGRSCLRALWDAGCKRWFGGLEATCLPHPHTLGRQGHNSSQWLGSHLPTPFSTALMSKVLIRDDGNGPERWRMSALSASWCGQENKHHFRSSLLLAKELVPSYPTSCIPAAHSRGARR